LFESFREIGLCFIELAMQAKLTPPFCFCQKSQEKYWEEHPGEAVPIMPPKFYWGPWRVMNGEVPRFIQPPDEAKPA